MKKFFYVITILLLSACGTTDKYEAILDSWLGSTESHLVDSWGPPSGVYENGGKRYLTYIQSRSGYIPGTAPTYQTQIYGNTAYTTSYGGSPGFAFTRSCKTTFTISRGTIRNWRHEGNNCVAE